MLKKILSMVMAILMAFSTSAFAVEPIAEQSKTTATINVTVNGVLDNATGYQLLLDSNADIFERGIVPRTGRLSNGDSTSAIYSEFEYKLPEDASHTTMTNAVIPNGTTMSINIPAGTYDFCFVRPVLWSFMDIANSQDGSWGRGDNYVFAAGYTFNFVISVLPDGTKDLVELTNDGAPAPAVSVVLDRASANMELGTTLQLLATMQYPNTSSHISSWASSDTSVASVNSSGLVSANDIGVAIITATTDNGLTASCEISVSTIASALNAPAMNLSYTNDPINPWLPDSETFADRNVVATAINGMSNTSTTLSVTANMAAGEAFSFDWFISCEGFYEFDEDEINEQYSDWYDYVSFRVNGEFTFRAMGLSPSIQTYIFTAPSAGEYTFSWTYQKSESFNMRADTFYLDNCLLSSASGVDSVTLTPSSATIQEAQTITLTAMVLPPTAPDMSVSWSSSDNSIAVVDSYGFVTGISSGVVTITARSNSNSDVYGTSTITVLTAAQANQALRDALNIEGGSLPFVNDYDNPWAVDSETYEGRTVAASNIAGQHNTTSTIRLTEDAQVGDYMMFDWMASCEYSYYDHFEFLVNGVEVMRIGGTDMTDFERVEYAIPQEGTYTFEWRYVKDSTLSSGLDTVWLDEVDFGPKPILSAIELSENDIELGIGGYRQINVSPVPQLAVLSQITWTSSNNEVATVANGVISAVALGSAVITATSAEGFTATVNVNVIEEVYAYGYVVYNGTTGFTQYSLISGTSVPMGNTLGEGVSAMEYINGEIYGFTMEGEDMVPFFFKTVHGDFQAIRLPAETAICEMAYDNTTSTIYAIGDYGMTHSLYTLDPYTNVLTFVAPITGTVGSLLTLACTPDGQLYGTDLVEGNFYSIDKSTGRAKLIGSTGLRPIYTQSLTYDYNRDVMIYAAYTSDFEPEQNAIYEIDITTGELTRMYMSNSGQICGLYIPYDATPLPEEVNVGSVSLSESAMYLDYNESAQLTASIYPANSNDQRLVWSSSNPKVAVVSQEGTVLGTGEGEAAISVTTNDGGFVATCMVLVGAVPEDEMFLYGYNIYNPTRDEGVMRYAINADASYQVAEFGFTPYALEYINGTIYGYTLTGGAHYIIASAETYESQMITSQYMMYDLAYDHSTGVLYGLGTVANVWSLFTIDLTSGNGTLIGTITGSDMTNAPLTLACSTDGQLYCVEAATGYLYSINSETAQTSLIGETGKIPNFIQSMTYDHKMNRLIWAYCGSGSDSGNIYEVNTETAELTLLLETNDEIAGLYMEYEGTPPAGHVSATGITISQSEAELAYNSTLQISAQVIPANASNKNVIWSSSNNSVVTVTDSGLLRAVAPGTAIITAQSLEGGFKATCAITVNHPINDGYVYVRTTDIVPGETYVIAATNYFGEKFTMSGEYLFEDTNGQLKGVPGAYMTTYHGQQAIYHGISPAEEWLFEASGSGVTMRNMQNQLYANPVMNIYDRNWLGLVETPTMNWIWNNDLKYFDASNASELEMWNVLAFGNIGLEGVNAFDLFAPTNNYFFLELYVKTQISDAPDEQFQRALNVEGGELLFENDSVYPWAVSTDASGRYFAKSTTTGWCSTTTSISTTTTLEAGNRLSFDWYVNCQNADYDNLSFYVNGELIERIGGAFMTHFTNVTYTAPADGTYTFSWVYAKDDEHNNGLDVAWLDNVAVENAGLMGDANCDGNVNTGDVAAILRYLVGLDQIIDLSLCDLNGDGYVNSGDAAYLLEQILDI